MLISILFVRPNYIPVTTMDGRRSGNTMIYKERMRFGEDELMSISSIINLGGTHMDEMPCLKLRLVILELTVTIQSTNGRIY